jgi:MFS family permease
LLRLITGGLATREARLLAGAGLLRSVGTGGMLAMTVIFMTVVVGLPATQVALALSLAGGAAAVVAVPLGHLSDRVGARRVTTLGLVLVGVVTLSYPVVATGWHFVVLAICSGVLDVATQASRSALLAEVVPRVDRVRVRAQVRVVTNLGMAVGAGGAALVIAQPTRWSFGAGYSVLACCFLAGAGVYRRLPRSLPAAPGPAPEAMETSSLTPDPSAPRVLAMLGIAAGNAVLCMNAALLTLGIPLFMHEQGLPLTLASVLLAVNTLAVVLLQVRVGARVTDLDSGGRAMLRSGLVFLLCCTSWFLAGEVGSSALVVVLLVAGTLAHVTGELWHSAGAWATSFEVAAEGTHGKVQAVFALSQQAGSALAPLLVATVVVGGGPWGWLVIGAVMALGGASARAACVVWSRSPEIRRTMEPCLE